MKSTLYLKFILLYIILGFLSIFTVASLSSTLTTHYLESSISGNMYQSANLLASTDCRGSLRSKTEAHHKRDVSPV